MTPDLSTWMTKQQVAAALGVSEKTVSRMAAKGELGEPQIRGGKETGETPRPVYDPAMVAKASPSYPARLPFNAATPKLLAPPAVPDAPPKAKPLTLSELRFKTFLTTDEAVRYSGLPEAVLVDLAQRGYIRRLETMKPYRYQRVDLEAEAMEDRAVYLDKSRRDEGEGHEDPEIHGLQVKEGSDAREACGLCGNAITEPHMTYCPYSI